LTSGTLNNYGSLKLFWLISFTLASYIKHCYKVMTKLYMCY